MIKPTNGRIVWYTPCHADIADAGMVTHGQPLSAIVTHAWGERCVNLAVFDANGKVHEGITSVLLLQDDDVPLEGGRYCEWMPFQKDQAARTEQLERQAGPAA